MQLPAPLCLAVPADWRCWLSLESGWCLAEPPAPGSPHQLADRLVDAVACRPTRHSGRAPARWLSQAGWWDRRPERAAPGQRPPHPAAAAKAAPRRVRQAAAAVPGSACWPTARRETQPAGRRPTDRRRGSPPASSRLPPTRGPVSPLPVPARRRMGRTVSLVVTSCRPLSSRIREQGRFARGRAVLADRAWLCGKRQAAGQRGVPHARPPRRVCRMAFRCRPAFPARRPLPTASLNRCAHPRRHDSQMCRAAWHASCQTGSRPACQEPPPCPCSAP